MDLYNLRFADLGTSGSFHTKGGSNLIGIRGRAGVSAIIFQCILNEDSDGALTTYGPPGIRPAPLDPLGDATSQQNPSFVPGKNTWIWVGLVSKTKVEAQRLGVRIDQNPALEDFRHRFPVIQQSGVGRGFYISTTATARNTSLPETNPARYWDAASISYGALTPPLRKNGVRMGDFGLAIRRDTGVADGFVYVDSGAGDKVGESSRKLFRTLFPRRDQENHPVSFMVFPRSGYQPILANPTLAIRPRLGDLSTADNFDSVIAMMASGLAYKATGGLTDIARLNNSPDGQRITTALAQWGYSKWTSLFRERSNSDVLRLQIPRP